MDASVSIGGSSGEDSSSIYIPISQRVELWIYPFERRIQGLTGIIIKRNDATSKDLNLKINARQLEVESVTLDDVPLQFTYQNDDWSDIVKTVIPPENSTECPILYPNKLRQSIMNEVKKKELSISLPETIPSQFEIKVKFNLKNPSSGIYFVQSSQSSFFQVHSTPLLGMTRFWLPCFEGIPVSWEFQYNTCLEGGPSQPSQITNNVLMASAGALCEQFVHQKERNMKTFKFKLDIPTIPSQISFVVGLFESVKIPAAPFAIAYCPLGMGEKLSLAVEFFSRAFGFVNGYLSTSFPYPSLYLSFLKFAQSSDQVLSSANMISLSVKTLHDSSIIDQIPITRQLLAEGLCQQYFGIRLGYFDSSSRWITNGITVYLSKLLLRIFHGNNDYKYNLKRDINKLVDLDATMPSLSNVPEFLSNPNDLLWFNLKSYLVFVSMEHRLDKEGLQKIMSFIWDEFINGRFAQEGLNSADLFRAARKVSGKEFKSFAEQYILSAGSPIFTCTFNFNRKKSVLDVTLKQSIPGHEQVKISGNLLIRVHETEGVFDHNIHIDDFSHHFELPVHAKAKKMKRKKPAVTGEEAKKSTSTTATSSTTADEEAFVSPISWIRLDPEMEWIGMMEINQPDFMSIEQLQHDRDAAAQFEAIQSLKRSPSDSVLDALEKVLNDPKYFYKIRIDAAEALANCTPNPEMQSGGLKIIAFYNKGFAMQSSETLVVPVPKPNNFEALQSYFIQKSLPGAIALIRSKNPTMMELVGQVLLNMLRFNDNSVNQYSDNYYVPAVMRALVVHLQVRKEIDVVFERLIKEFIKELDRYAIVERIQPYFHNTVMVAIIESAKSLLRLTNQISFAIVKIERLICEGNSLEVRLAALEYFLVSEQKCDFNQIFECFKNLILNEKVSIRRETVMKMLKISTRQFTCKEEMRLRIVSLNEILESLGNDHETRNSLLSICNKWIDSSSQDAQTTSTSKISLKISIPLTSTTVMEEEGNDANWLLDISEDTPTTSTLRADVPKLKLSVPSFLINPESEMTMRLLDVFRKIWDNYDSFPFRYPVVAEGYYEVIKDPIDLSTIKERISEGIVKSPESFTDLLRLLFDNCFYFNLPDSPICEQARRLRTFAYKELKAAFPLIHKELKQVLITKNNTELEVIASPVTIKEPAPKKSKKAKVQKKESVGPKIDEMTVNERMLAVLDTIQSHSYAFWFMDPVDPVALNIPTYPEIIKEPMDLGTLRRLLEEGTFEGRPDEFVRCLDLIFTNCTTFNPPNTVVHQNAIQIRKEATRLVKKNLSNVEKTAANAVSVTETTVAESTTSTSATGIRLKINLTRS